MKGKQKPVIPDDVILVIMALFGIAVFIFLLEGFYPYRAANMRIGKAQAVELGRSFLEDAGYDVSSYRVRTIMQYDAEAFIFLQQKYGYEAAQDMVRYKMYHGFDFVWVVSWMKNLPPEAPQERFDVRVSGFGKIVGYHHAFPRIFNWPRPDRARLSAEEAQSIVRRFLSQNGIPMEGFHVELVSSQLLEKRTDHTLIWRNTSDFDDSYVELTVRVQGDEVGDFNIRFQIPDAAVTSINRQTGIEFFRENVIAVSVLFLIGLFALSVFLKKYHEGEVEVRTGGLVFWILMSAYILQAILRFQSNGNALLIGELNADGAGLVIFILLILIIRPLQSIFGFTSWSVGESLGRERHVRTFSAIDSLFHRRFFTKDLAAAIGRGYLAAGIILGLIALSFWLSLEYLGCTTRIPRYEGLLNVPLPFLIPALMGLTGGLLGEMIFRLFGQLVVYRTLRVKLFASMIAAAFWSFAVPSFWGGSLSLYPIDFEILIWFIIGVVLGLLFWRYDLVTVIFANIITISVIQTLPLITSTAGSVRIQGVISICLLSLPVIPMIVGFIRREQFKFQQDLIPGHIRRITERVRMSEELEIARQVQNRLLPKDSPVLPGFEIMGACIPAKETGGDYFDFIDLGESKWGVIIGDVSGKGVPAAIYMTLTKGIVQSHADDFISPVDVLVKVNELLYRTIDRDYFVSLFYSVLDLNRNELVFARAGHNPVLHWQDAKKGFSTLETGGIGLGLENGRVFESVISERTVTLESNDILIYYTDGVVEAMNRKAEEYGEERLKQVVEAHCSQGVDAIYQGLMKDIKQFVRDVPQKDDMTIVLLKKTANDAHRERTGG